MFMTPQNETEPYPPAEGREGPREIETTRARQGETLGRVRYILLISTLLVVVAFAIIYLANFPI